MNVIIYFCQYTGTGIALIVESAVEFQLVYITDEIIYLKNKILKAKNKSLFSF